MNYSLVYLHSVEVEYAVKRGITNITRIVFDIKLNHD